MAELCRRYWQDLLIELQKQWMVHTNIRRPVGMAKWGELKTLSEQWETTLSLTHMCVEWRSEWGHPLVAHEVCEVLYRERSDIILQGRVVAQYQPHIRTVHNSNSRQQQREALTHRRCRPVYSEHLWWSLSVPVKCLYKKYCSLSDLLRCTRGGWRTGFPWTVAMNEGHWSGWRRERLCMYVYVRMYVRTYVCIYVYVHT